MKNTSKRILFMILAAVFLIAAVFVYTSLIKPTYGDVTTLRSQLASKQDSLDRYQNTLKKMQSLLQQLQNAGDVQRQVSLVLPNERDLGYFMSQLVELPRINGLSSSVLSTQSSPIQPSKSAAIKSVGRIKGELQLSGSYSGFKALLRQLEKNILLMDVTDIRIEGTQSQSSLNYAISVSSYYQAGN